ncbi:MAG: hypothetical protein HUU32_04730 [Calditrichaceae bacterium]|nr:hypothetical protein [Calditrichia bacterium]NUQ40679.1 hypothetical protein [Calditrichaceae bacterium]
MKTMNFMISLLSLIFLGQILSCSSLKKAKLSENPEFEKNAEKFVITSPLSHSPSQSNKFIIEDVSADTVFEIETHSERPESDRNTIEGKTTEEGYKVKSKEFTSYKFYIAKPFYESHYEVIGKATRFRTEEDKGDRGTESTQLAYPLEFWIFEEGKDVGKITVSEPNLNLTGDIAASIHGKHLNLKYQADMFNKTSVSFEDEQGLLAFFHSKSSGFISTKQKGEFLIKHDLPEELKLDILATYMIVETIMGINSGR